MSAQSLTAFLNKLQSELERSKGPYRSLVANIRPHFYRFRVGDLVTETIKQFNKKNIPITEEEKQVITGFAEEMKQGLEQRLEQIKQSVGGNLKVTNKTIELTFTSETDTSTIISAKQAESKYRDPASVFQKVKDFYRPELDTYFEKVQNYLATRQMEDESGAKKAKFLRTRSGRRKRGVTHVFDAGHIGEAGVLQSRIADAFNSAALEIIDEGNEAGMSDLKSDLKALGISLSIVRNDSTDSHSVQIESASRNRAAGARIEKQRKKLEDQIKLAVKKLESGYGPGLIDLKGSDSLRTKKTKQSVDAVMTPLTKLKKPKSGSVKVTKEDTKIKKSSTRPQSKTSTPKAGKGSSRSYGTVKGKASTSRGTSRASRQPGIASNPLALINEFNRRLPSQIIENMGEPALENRTGRFAASVRVVDILQTPKGFPSIGYTYMKSPYQTFEQGGRQGTPDRDPRMLIDKTIREIAAEFAMGRLFTRRV